MIDSHAHLADMQFATDIEEVLHRAEEHGIEAMIAIADSIDEGRKCLFLAENHDQIYCTIGVHPHTAQGWKEGDGDTLRRLILSSPKVKAVGEIGLDYHYNFSPRDIQKSVFREQLLLAKQLGLPSVVHCREAIGDLRTIIEEVQPPRLVLHCCTEKWEDVAWLIDAGHLLSFTGIITYANAGDIRETVKRCPLDRLMIETDAPYLAPVPHRGKRNEPAFVVEVAKKVAEIKGVALEEADRQTTANTVAFFGLGS